MGNTGFPYGAKPVYPSYPQYKPAYPSWPQYNPGYASYRSSFQNGERSSILKGNDICSGVKCDARSLGMPSSIVEISCCQSIKSNHPVYPAAFPTSYPAFYPQWSWPHSNFYGKY